MSRKQWRCFHCDEVFTRVEDAAEHFGGQQGALAACQIKGADLTLIGYVRELEVALARWQMESHPLLRAMAAMEADMDTQKRRAEELGYGRGVRDMRDHISGALV